MKKNGFFVFLGLLSLGGGLAGADSTLPPSNNKKLIVRFNNLSVQSFAAMKSTYKTLGIQSVRHFSPRFRDFQVLVLKDSADLELTMQRLRAHPAVASVQENFAIEIPENTGLQDSDPIAQEQQDAVNRSLDFPFLGIAIDTPKPELKPAPADVYPAVTDPGLNKLYGLEKIQAFGAWSQFQGDRKIVVAVIDTGIDYNHPDLAGNLWRNPNPTKGDVVGYDFVNNDGLPYDDHMHGTHTSGTVGAVWGNGQGISGVAPRVSVMGLKFLDRKGSGDTEGAIRAIDYAIENGAKVLSNSWGGTFAEQNEALSEAVKRAMKAGVLFVAAAGNSSKNNDKPDQASYPAGFTHDNIVSVAATNSSDRMAFFSNYGKKTTHLGAPGVQIISLSPANTYKAESGTSMACPHVAGAAAFLWAMNPAATYQEIKSVLLAAVDPVSSLKEKTITGGRLNLHRAFLNYRAILRARQGARH